MQGRTVSTRDNTHTLNSSSFPRNAHQGNDLQIRISLILSRSRAHHRRTRKRRTESHTAVSHDGHDAQSGALRGPSALGIEAQRLREEGSGGESHLRLLLMLSLLLFVDAVRRMLVS